MACRKAGLAPGRADCRCGRSARPARRCRPTASAGCTTPSAPACRSTRSRAAPTCAPRSSAWRRSCRCAPARSAAGCSAAPSRRSTRRPAVPAGRAGRARHHPADAVDAGRLLGRRRRPEPRRAPPTSATSPACGATATGSPSPTTAPARSPGRSDATLNRGGVRLGTADFYAVVEAAARGGRQPRRAPRRRAGATSCGSSSQLAPGVDARRRPPAPDRRRPADRAVAPARARPRRGRAGRAPDALGQEARGPGEAHPHRRRRPTSPPAAAPSPTPDSLAWFEQRADER